ncbi:MAG TPA: hypothetical protein VIG88_13705, partial [Lysobacter sp.]
MSDVLLLGEKRPGEEIARVQSSRCGVSGVAGARARGLTRFTALSGGGARAARNAGIRSKQGAGATAAVRGQAVGPPRRRPA